MFVVCRTCGESLFQNGCENSSESRGLSGIRTPNEVRKAVEIGYLVFDMYELWEYEVAAYGNRGLFLRYHQHIFENETRGFRLS